MIVGLIGPNASGKGEIAQIFKEKKFKYYSLSDIIREECKAKGKEETRENLQKIGNQLRKRYSPRFLAKKINEKIEEDMKKGQKDFVVDSIRNVKEVAELQKNKDFYLLGIDAPVEDRFLRAKQRGRNENAETLDEFVEMENKEKGNNPLDQQIDKVYKLSDKFVYNDGTLGDLKERIEYALAHERKKRPDWDTYFMNICDVVKTRATCLRREVGAVLVKDKQIISTGYNGPPKGHPHCDALGGCLRTKLGIPSGQQNDISRAAHAEMNAISQAAANGVNTNGSTLYCTTFPCSICMRILANSGIKRVVYKEFYNDTVSKSIANRVNIKLEKFEKKMLV